MEILERYFEILGHFPQYETRQSQERMVGRVWQALENRRSLVVEAGTGSGKSFGYLIPALLSSSRPVVISTGTIALQEQLLSKDIPFLAAASGLENLKIKLVKGRKNYLCIQKLLETEREIQAGTKAHLHIQYLKGMLADGWDGDMANLDIPIPKELWDDVASDTEDCLGHRCQFYQENPYRQARENLDKADIIVANHALYLQDLVSGQSLLPAHDVVIFDEAHNLKNYALNAFTARIGKYATGKLLRKIQRRLQPIPESFIQEITETEASILTWLFQSKQGNFRLVPDENFLGWVGRHTGTLTELYEWLCAVDVAQLPLVESELDADRASIQRTRILTQLQGLTGRWEYFMAENPFSASRVNWVSLDKDRLYFELKSTPLDIAGMLRESLWPEKTAILTSATLSVHNRLDFFKQELGLSVEAGDTELDTGNLAPDTPPDTPPEALQQGVDDLILPSPFSYAEQCALYLPDNMPDPNTPEFVRAAADEIEALLNISQGRAFVLFTSYQNMSVISDALIPRLPWPCKVQGELPRNRLIEWFKETPNSVLFATATFWEGIDVPGEALSCVIIDKIPFTSPEDPVNQAMVDYLKAQGKDWFGDYVLPQAIIKLKQGFGRLIRHQDDRGLVAILDPRLRTKGYGSRIVRSLPKVPTVHRLETLLDTLPAGQPPQKSY